MNDNQQLFFLILFLLPFAVGLTSIWPYYRQVKRDRNRYRFFAFRDKLIGLVACGKLEETDFLFQEFYSLVNKIVNRTEIFTFSSFVKSLGYDLENKEYVSRMASEFDKIKDEEVMDVFVNFFDSVICSFRSNSLTFLFLERLLLINKSFVNNFKKFPKIKKAIVSVFNKSYTAYSIERNIRRFGLKRHRIA